MIRRIIACAVVALVAMAGFGAAATVAIESDRVSTSSESTTMSCTAATVTYEYAGTDVSQVQVTGLPSACRGQIWIALLDAGGVVVSQGGPVASSGPGNATIDVPDVAATSVKKYSIAVVK